MKETTRDIFLVLIGVILASTGLVMVKTLADPQGMMRALPYVCIGIGCGIFGQGTGNVISRGAIKKYPHFYKQMEIDQKDERNNAINNLAKARSYDMMVFVFGALMVSFALMGVDMMVLLLLVFAYLFIVFCGVYYRSKYEKEM